MITVDISSVRSIIETNALVFLQEIRNRCSISNKTVHNEKAFFPLFHPANQDFFEYKYYENTLEWYIREFLVTPILVSLFKTQKIQVELSEEKPIPGVRRARISYSNEEFAKRMDCAFQIANNGIKVGVRYSGIYVNNDEEALKLLDKYGWDHIEILVWDDTDSTYTKQVELTVSPELRHRFPYITFRAFIEKYFSEEIYTCLLNGICDAVEEANKEIGFNTIPNLSLRYLSDFKERFLCDISEMPLCKIRYREFDKNGEPTSSCYSLLSQADYSIINKRFFDEGLYKSLAGTEEFAKCFITSEYLYQVFQKGNEKCFDYSSVATGYFKAVELLLKKIMDLALKCKGHDNLWIKYNKRKKIKEDDIDYRYNPNNRSVVQVRFTEERKDDFAIEMGPLVNFLFDRKNGWNISEDGQEIVYKCLLNYSSNCRNGHLHKDIIDDFQSIVDIRNNTILCIYYLLGSCKLTDQPDEDCYTLGVDNNTFNKLYKILVKMRPLFCFYLQFEGSEEIMAIKTFDQEDPCYDTSGNIVSRIQFVRVNSFDAAFSEELFSHIPKENEFYLSRDNVPKRMWWYNKFKGKNEIVW